MSGVTFDSATKAFGDFLAVDKFTLDIQDGEFMVLLGPSGCGKTTALRMIAGLEDVTSGYVSIGDRVVNNIPPKERDIAMVFQSYALYPHMTVRKNIESPLVANRSARVESHQRNERVQEAADILDLTDYLNRKPGELSGGQRQRVALARAIVRRPEVFLMDEPLSNLDAKLRTRTRLEIVNLQRRLGTTFVYVTHDQVEAMTMADRIAVISEGSVQQVGRPQDVYDLPANLFVARFIGSPPMNTISGIYSAGSGTKVVSTESGSIDLPAGTHSELADGAPVVMGIRPEHMNVTVDQSSESPEAPANPLPGTGLRGNVIATELLGPEVHVIISVGEERFVVRHATNEPSAAHPGSSRDAPAYPPGTSVILTPDPSRIILFDPESTNLLPTTG